MYQVQEILDGVKILEDSFGLNATIVMVAEWEVQQNQLAFISDETGLSVDHPAVELADDMLLAMSENK